MNYILICLLAFIFLKKGKLNPAMIPPAIELYKSIPKIDFDEIRKGDFDFTTLAPVITSFENLMQTANYEKPSETSALYETKPMQSVANFAPSEFVYSVRDYVEE